MNIVSRDIQNNTHRFGGSNAYRDEWNRTKALRPIPSDSLPTMASQRTMDRSARRAGRITSRQQRRIAKAVRRALNKGEKQ